MLLPSTLSSLHLPQSPPCSASPSALPLLEVVSPSPSPARPSTRVESPVLEPPSVPEHIDPVDPIPASDHLALSRPVDLSAPHWVLPPLVSPDTLCLSTPPGSLVPPAPPWSVVTPHPPRTCGSSPTFRSSTPMAAASAACYHHPFVCSSYQPCTSPYPPPMPPPSPSSL